ncbi:hypothetical protein [Leptolyngbya ohadii]|uniref:hypothetical protein n=1 Tax=Leptolyngbya ohadii TaxID=1962290 RepID=UPI000B5994D4|nr:hypothetical protein [Leptolyngbya ohadii]
MSIDQTSQLIQLMLNSLLMMAFCGSVVIGLMLRQGAIAAQLRLLKPLHAEAVNGVRSLAPARFMQLKAQLRLLRHSYRLVRIAGWSANGALILCTSSTLLLALRTLILLDRLIPISLLLFTCGAALLLCSLILGLLSLVETNSLEERESESRGEHGEPQNASDPTPDFRSRRDRSSLKDPAAIPMRLALRTTSRTSLPTSVPPSRISSSQSVSRSHPPH